jgi:hypothetical protein
LSRVINPESAAADRGRLSKVVVFALRELMKQTETSDQTRDLVTFMSLALREMYQTVETSVVAWEKRGYWVKADKFRMEWEWAEIQGRSLETALLKDDWLSIAKSATNIGQKLNKIKLGATNRGMAENPWAGSWDKIKQKKSS